MAVNLKFIVEDVAVQLATYTQIRIYRSATLGGAYSSIADVTLVAGTYYYSYEDSGGNLNSWYKYSFRNPTGPVESDLSAPFRVDGVTRLRARQAALEKYGAGIILIAAAGSDTNTVVTADYRVKSSLWRTDRGKGTWLMPTTGSAQGQIRVIKSSVPSTGTLEIEPDYGAAVATSDEVEWHWLADPAVWNAAINRGLARYWYTERIPIVGVANQEEYDLSGIPFLKDIEQIHDVRWYPTSGKDVDEPYGVDGKWWRPRQDVDKLTLVIFPPVGITTTLYIEATRPMQALYADDAVAPPTAAEELVTALAYDEVLAYLASPGVGSSESRALWTKSRQDHLPELHRLLVKYRPKPRAGPAQLPWPPVVPTPFKAR